MQRHNQPIIPVILSGGAGTRLWPLSREARPKQFLPLITERSLFQETVLRLGGLGGSVTAPMVVCNEGHRFLVAEQLREIATAARPIVLEPAARNTGPAVAAAALLAQRFAARADDGARSARSAGALLLVLPADHVILNKEAFGAAVAAAAEAAEAGYLVTFGIVPDRPETGYGYILQGAARGRWSLLEQFVEKPDLATAERYVESGRYLWNSGMFLFSADAYLAELARFEPGMLDACRAAVADAAVDPDFTRLGEAFSASPSRSIDYAVMEKTDKAAVVPLDAGWSDVGSWAALHDVLDKDSSGNVIRGTVILEGCRNSYVASSTRLVAAVGLEGVVIVETDDAVLVVARDESQAVKAVVDRLNKPG